MNKYTKVVIVTPGLMSIDRPPAAAAWLAGVCEHHRVDYEVFDFNIHFKNILGTDLWEELFVAPVEDDRFVAISDPLLQKLNNAISTGVDYILSLSPDLVAISVLSFLQHPYAKLIVSAIKEKSKVTIIAGGTGISYQTSQGTTVGYRFAKAGLIDYYVLGEGDHIFGSFLCGEIGLGVNHKDAKWENWVPQIDNLNGLILPSYKKIKLDDYEQTEINGKLMPSLTITGSRGCVRRCTFCDIGHVWKKFRFRTAEDIAQEILHHYLETQTVRFHFSDSLINGSLKHFIALMEKLIDLQQEYPDLKHLKIDGQYIIREKKHHPEYMYELMKKAGVFRLETGIESGSERVRTHMGKKFSNDDLDYHYDMCSKYGITNSVLLFTGYVTETLEDHHDTLNMLRNHQKYLIDGTISILVLSEPLVMLRNTPLAEMQDELDIELFNNEYGNTLFTTGSNPTLTVEEKYRRYLETNRLSIELGYPRSFDVVQKTIEKIKEIIQLKGTNKKILAKFNELIHNTMTEGM